MLSVIYDFFSLSLFHLCDVHRGDDIIISQELISRHRTTQMFFVEDISSMSTMTAFVCAQLKGQANRWATGVNDRRSLFVFRKS